MAIRSYLPEMGDIATQLVEKWSRLNPDEDIDVAGDMTRLTLDTIGLCAFSYRFNSFYSKEPHPFVVAMVDALEYATTSLSKLPIQRRLDFRPSQDAGGCIDTELPRRSADRHAASGPGSKKIH